MELSGEARIPARRDAVWRALNDPEALEAAIPGCEAVTRVSDTEFDAVVSAAVGPVSARFSGRITLADIDAPRGYTIHGQGQGGAAGFARGQAKVTLIEDGGATILRYAVDAQIGGKLAQVGQRVVDAAARQMADAFFANFSETVSGVRPRPAAKQGAAQREARAAEARTMLVNGRRVDVDVEPRTLLVHFLRERLHLTGAHVGCDTSQCGVCVVHVDGRAVKSCTMLAAQAVGAEVVTIEGVAEPGTLHPVQAAFKEHHGLQCGFCTPGMVMSAIDMIRRRGRISAHEIREELEGNLCRCTGYANIVRAIEAAMAEATP